MLTIFVLQPSDVVVTDYCITSTLWLHQQMLSIGILWYYIQKI